MNPAYGSFWSYLSGGGMYPTREMTAAIEIEAKASALDSEAEKWWSAAESAADEGFISVGMFGDKTYTLEYCVETAKELEAQAASLHEWAKQLGYEKPEKTEETSWRDSYPKTEGCDCANCDSSEEEIEDKNEKLNDYYTSTIQPVYERFVEAAAAEGIVSARLKWDVRDDEFMIDDETVTHFAEAEDLDVDEIAELIQRRF